MEQGYERLSEQQKKMLDDMKKSAKNDIAKHGEFDHADEAYQKLRELEQKEWKHRNVFKATAEFGGKFVICEEKWLCGLAPIGFRHVESDTEYEDIPDDIVKRFTMY